MTYSFSLYFWVQPFEFLEDSRMSMYDLNLLVFGIALSLELLYWAVSRIFLTAVYIKSYSRLEGRTCCHTFSVVVTHTLMTIIPTEMLIFFGYHRT